MIKRNPYYEVERVKIVCVVEISYKKGSPDCREDAIRMAQFHLNSSGAGLHGCYGARIIEQKTQS